MLLRGRRITAIAVALTFMVPLASCAGDGDGPDPTPGTTASATPTATDATDAAAVLEKFWAERVRVETSGNYDSASFEGIVAPDAIEPILQRYAQYDDGGFRRVGTPQLRDYVATVDGDSAIASVCVNEDDWGAEADGKIVESDPAGWYADSHELTRTDGAWLIVDDAKTPSGVTC